MRIYILFYLLFFSFSVFCQSEKENKLRQERLKKVISPLKKTYDEFDEITWYKDKTLTRRYNKVLAYFGISKDDIWLRFKIQYYAKDWLFIKGYQIKVGELKHSILDIDYEKVIRETSTDGIYEIFDLKVNDDLLKILKGIAFTEQKAILRCKGKNYNYDRTISSIERLALKNVLIAYNALGGEL